MIRAFWPDPALASIVPELLNVIWPSPMFPAPWIVSWFLNVLLPTEQKIRLLALFPIVSVPAPLKVTVEEPMISSVGLFPEFNEILPALEMLLPFTVSAWLSLIARLSSESMVKLLIAAFMSRVTGEASAFPLSMKTLKFPLGTPALQLLETLQFPEPPFQLSVVWPSADEGHSRQTPPARKSTLNIRVISPLRRSMKNVV